MVRLTFLVRGASRSKQRKTGSTQQKQTGIRRLAVRWAGPSKHVAKISRKQLKEDRFAQEVGTSVEYVAHHRKQVILAIVLVVAAIVGIAGFMRYRSQQADQARHAFQEAMNLYHGELETDEPQFGVITFATNIEKNTRVTEALEGVIRDYPSRFEGWAARYYLALHQIEQGKVEEGQKQLEAVTQGGDEEIASLARLALAHLLKTQGKKDEARQIYQYLVDHPTDLVAKPRSQLLLAEMLIESDPQQARTLLESLQTMPGAISVSAISLLPRLPPASSPAEPTQSAEPAEPAAQQAP